MSPVEAPALPPWPLRSRGDAVMAEEEAAVTPVVCE
jgi:hypothetical protein